MANRNSNPVQHAPVEVMPPLPVDNSVIVQQAQRDAATQLAAVNQLSLDQARRTYRTNAPAPWAGRLIQASQDAWIIWTIAIGTLVTISMFIIGLVHFTGAMMQNHDISVPRVRIER